MRSEHLKNAIRFCCTIDEGSATVSLTKQAEAAMRAGATMIRYIGEASSAEMWPELRALCRLCRSNYIPFMVRDHLYLAKALGADGIHLDRSMEHPEAVREILGPEAFIGKTFPPPLPDAVNSSCWDYIELSPIEPTITGIPASPLVTAGGIIDTASAQKALGLGAAGITADNLFFQPGASTSTLPALAKACGCPPRPELIQPWRDEFGLIEKLLEPDTISPDRTFSLIVPPGDDACLLSPLSRPVISTDTQREGVHFRLDWQTPEEIGRKAVSVTLSDLAASYARPVSFFVNLSIPPHTSETFIVELYKGIREALGRYDCTLGGGNISGGGELSLDLFAIGEGDKDLFPKRSGAKPGYELYVTGPLGMARAGLETLQQNDPDFPRLVQRFKEPAARFDAAGILAAHGVQCVMDISDGLSGDARHIARASHLTIELDVSGLTFDKTFVSFCRKYNHRPEALVLIGGEDYELLFACPPDTFNDLKNSLPDAAQVGRCIPFQGREIICRETGISSYQHGDQERNIKTQHSPDL